jgi:L-asparagine transporter-like permease
MSFSLPAVLACTFFYSALYLIYYYFSQYSHTLLIVSAIVLLILAWRITPYAYERGQNNNKSDRAQNKRKYMPTQRAMKKT